MKLFGWNALKYLRILSDWSSLLCFACFERFVPHLTSSKIWQPFWGCSLNYWRWSMGVSQSIRVNQDIPHVGMCCPPCVASFLHFGCWLACLILQSLREVALSTKKRVMPGALSVECWEDGGADIGDWQLNISRMTIILSSQCQQTNWNLFYAFWRWLVAYASCPLRMNLVDGSRPRGSVVSSPLSHGPHTLNHFSVFFRYSGGRNDRKAQMLCPFDLRMVPQTLKNARRGISDEIEHRGEPIGSARLFRPNQAKELTESIARSLYEVRTAVGHQ